MQPGAAWRRTRPAGKSRPPSSVLQFIGPGGARNKLAGGVSRKSIATSIGLIVLAMGATRRLNTVLGYTGPWRRCRMMASVQRQPICMHTPLEYTYILPAHRWSRVLLGDKGYWAVAASRASLLQIRLSFAIQCLGAGQPALSRIVACAPKHLHGPVEIASMFGPDRSV